MSRNGAGTYSLPEAAFVYDSVISETAVNSNFTDIASALTASLAANGETTVTANMPMNSKKFTGLAVGTVLTDSLTLGQAQNESYIWCGTMTGTADAGVLTPSPAITAYKAGQRFVWKASTSANTTAMTIAISGLTTIAAQNDRAALVAGDHAASDIYMGILDTTSTIQIMKFASAGDVVGPASATDGSLAKFDGTTGKLLKDGAVIGTDVLAPDGDGSGLTGITPGASQAEADTIKLHGIMILTNRDADLQLIEDGVEDAYTSAASAVAGGVSTSSTNYTYDATSNYYSSWDGTYGTTLVPVMTGYTAPSGTVTAGNDAESAGWGAFDSGSGVYWGATVAASWLAYEFTASQIIAQYAVTGATSSSVTAPKDWTFEGWNGSTWDVLDTVSGEVSWSDGERRTFLCTNATAYIKYRINVSAIQSGTTLRIRYLEMMASSAASNMTLLSNAVTAATEPNTATVLIIHEPVDSVTLNTDFTAEVSIDNGATYDAITISDVGSYDSVSNIIRGSVDVSARTGTTMIYRLKTLNTTRQNVHGISWGWSV